MKRILTLCCLGLSFVTMAQRPAPDQFPTSKGPLVVQPIFHASLVLTWNHKTVYIDPFNGAKSYEGLAKPDLILITDIHQDHLDTNTLNVIGTSGATFVVPQAVADKLPTRYKKNLVVLQNGKSTIQGDIVIDAIPMYNLPEAPDAMHTKGRGNGYVLRMGGKVVYVSGDTEDIPEMRSLKNIDIAFVCMNLPYTMDVDQAASAVIDFKPKVVYPYHYRGQQGLSDTEKFKDLVHVAAPSIDVRLRNWYMAAH